MAKLILEKHQKDKDRVEVAIMLRYGIGKETFKTKLRDDLSTRIRFLAYFLLKNHYRIDYETIGQMYQKHRTTIMNGVKRLDALTTLRNEAGELSKTLPKS